MSGDRPYVAVIGSSEADAEQARVAEEVGAELGRRGAVVVTGGLGGVMAAASKGARAAGATTVGLLPGRQRAAANPDVEIALATGLGEARNALVVHAVDAVIAVGGAFGTLSEIAFALNAGTPVAAIGSWELSLAGRAVDAVRQAESAPEAVEAVLGPDGV
jgi:uncharacterized protein (TIGR00725 family)